VRVGTEPQSPLPVNFDIYIIATSVSNVAYLNKGDVMIRNSPFVLQWLFQPIQGPGLLFSFVSFFTDGGTPLTSDQLVARPLPKHRTTQTQNKRIHTPNIHALSGIRTHDPSVRVSEDSSHLRLRGYCDRQETFVGM
jgi:hypothetical protein